MLAVDRMGDRAVYCARLESVCALAAPGVRISPHPWGYRSTNREEVVWRPSTYFRLLLSFGALFDGYLNLFFGAVTQDFYGDFLAYLSFSNKVS